MSEERLSRIIEGFNYRDLNLFFRSKCENYAEAPEDLSLYDDERFRDFQKLGEIRFDSGDKLVITTSLVSGDLTERSGKKAQYEKAKKILREQEIYDAGFFIFHDNTGSFRFSLVYAQFQETKRTFSNFRRFTYFVSEDQTNKTFHVRVGGCTFSSLEAVKDAFSVEKVNKEFYNHIARFFYRLTGYDCKREMTLPSVSDEDKKTYQEFVVRLIGRTIFCWFLKHKKSANGISLIPESILSSEAVKQNSQYYHSTLEKLFFEVLNTPQEQRHKNILPDADKIPFLNGGLFEPHKDDFYSGEPLYNLVIPDTWFEQFLEILEQYNFTIDENSTVDADVSVDPEMLGRIFENLLAEVNPETGETARKATGSYYTPRTIVDYMVDQSLKQYLVTKTKIDEDKITALLSYEAPEVALSESEKGSIISALDEIKIIDPACGSGAFPMGVLHKVLLVLEKIDSDLTLWLNRKLAHIEDKILKQEIQDELEKDNLEYIRKLLIIRDSIHGVDIQQIAVEISKLRVFLSLIVDEKIDDKEKNRDIKPLPNLEFKFVVANSLLGLPKLETDRKALIDFEDKESIEALARIRDNYFASYGEDKLKAEQEFIEVQKKMFQFYLQNLNQEQRNLVGTVKKVKTTSKTITQMLSEWEPFSNKQCDWFDLEWMFGIKGGFDIVIANPPYVRADSGAEHLLFREKLKQSGQYETLYEKWDLMIPFVEKGLRIGNANGDLIYIVSNAICTSKYASKLLDLVQERYYARSIDYFEDMEVFEAGVIPIVLHVGKTNGNGTTRKTIRHESFDNIKRQTEIPANEFKTLGRDAFRKEHTTIAINKQTVNLGDICYMSVGMVINADEKTAKGEFTKDDLISATKTNIHSRKYIEGKDIDSYVIKRARYLEWGTKRVPGQLRRATFPELYECPKIMRGRVTPSIYDEMRLLCNDSIVIFVKFGDLHGVENKSIQASIKKFNRLPRLELEKISERFDLKYLLAILNSSFAFKYLNNIRRHRLENYFYPDDFRKLPIRDIPKQEQKPLVELVDNIISLTQSSDYMQNPAKQAKVKEYERQIDQMVYELYGLTPEEREIVEGSIK